MFETDEDFYDFLIILIPTLLLVLALSIGIYREKENTIQQSIVLKNRIEIIDKTKKLIKDGYLSEEEFDLFFKDDKYMQSLKNKLYEK